jgi:hypothetical protein
MCGKNNKDWAGIKRAGKQAAESQIHIPGSVQK